MVHLCEHCGTIVVNVQRCPHVTLGEAWPVLKQLVARCGFDTEGVEPGESEESKQ